MAFSVDEWLMCYYQLGEVLQIDFSDNVIHIFDWSELPFKRFCSADNILQVGTVLNAEDAIGAMNAGAKFIMSPAMVKVWI